MFYVRFYVFKCVFYVFNYVFKSQKSDNGRLYHTLFECDIGGCITLYGAVSHSAVAKWMIKYYYHIMLLFGRFSFSGPSYVKFGSTNKVEFILMIWRDDIWLRISIHVNESIKYCADITVYKINCKSKSIQTIYISITHSWCISSIPICFQPHMICEYMSTPPSVNELYVS